MRGVTPLLRCARVLLECAVLGSTEVAGPNAPLLAADSARLLAELLPEETAAELFSGARGGKQLWRRRASRARERIP